MTARRVLVVAALVCSMPVKAWAQPSPLSPPRTRPQDTPRVLVLPDPDLSTGSLERLMDEGAAAGFDMQSAQPPNGSENGGSDIESHLRQRAQRERALAAVVLAEDEAVVWIAEPQSGETTLMRMEGARYRGTEGGRVLALRIVEVLHAALIEVHPRTPRAEPPTPIAEAQPSKVRVAVGLGVRALIMPNLGAALVGPQLTAVELRVTPWLGISANLWSSVYRAVVEEDQGRASIGLASARLRGHIDPFRWGPVRLGFVLGWGALVAWVEGSAQPPLEGRTDWTVTSFGSLGVRGRLALSDSWAVTLEASATTALPQLEVVFDGQVVRDSSPVFAEAGLNLEWNP